MFEQLPGEDGKVGGLTRAQRQAGGHRQAADIGGAIALHQGFIGHIAGNLDARAIEARIPVIRRRQSRRDVHGAERQTVRQAIARHVQQVAHCAFRAGTAAQTDRQVGDFHLSVVEKLQLIDGEFRAGQPALPFGHAGTQFEPVPGKTGPLQQLVPYRLVGYATRKADGVLVDAGHQSIRSGQRREDYIGPHRAEPRQAFEAHHGRTQRVDIGRGSGKGQIACIERQLGPGETARFHRRVATHRQILGDIARRHRQAQGGTAQDSGQPRHDPFEKVPDHSRSSPSAIAARLVHFTAAANENGRRKYLFFHNNFVGSSCRSQREQQMRESARFTSPCGRDERESCYTRAGRESQKQKGPA